jgi:hypothetical protein
MWGLLRWMNPAYPIGKVLSPFVRSPTRSFAVVGKPVADAAATLMERNKETLTMGVVGDVEGTVTVTVPYDQKTLEKILAVAILPQVLLMQAAYAIPEVQRDLNALWRTLSLNKAKPLPKWKGIQSLFGRKATQTVESRTAIKLAASGASRGAGSFIPVLNVVIWVDTAILVATGLADLLISEETEEALGVNVTPYSPIGEIINGLIGWTAEQLGIGKEEIIRTAEEVGLDTLAQAGFAMVADLVVLEEAITVETDLEIGVTEINLDLDGRTLGETLGLALQLATVNEALSIEWGSRIDLTRFFLLVMLSLTLIGFGRQLLRLIRG